MIDHPMLELLARRAKREHVLSDALAGGDPRLAAASALHPVRDVVARLLHTIEHDESRATDSYWQLIEELDELVGASVGPGVGAGCAVDTP